MKELRVCYSPQQIAWMTVVGFLVASVLTGFRWGLPFIIRAWSDPVFWATMGVAMAFLSVSWWMIFATSLRDDGVSAIRYPFKVKWQDVEKCTVSRMFGVSSLKIYGSRSRFALRIPVSKGNVSAIAEFMEHTRCAHIVMPALRALPTH